jgi:Mn2+/Fe2+ NRAMP family transporter
VKTGITNGYTTVTLSEVHLSASIPRDVGRLRRLFAFAGPAFLGSVGCMDPGNRATDLKGGAQFGYHLISGFGWTPRLDYFKNKVTDWGRNLTTHR